MKENESIAKSAFGRIAIIKDQLLGSGLLGGITMIATSTIPGLGARAWVFTICGPALVIFVVVVYVMRGNGAPSSGQEVAVEKTLPAQRARDGAARQQNEITNGRVKNLKPPEDKDKPEPPEKPPKPPKKPPKPPKRPPKDSDET